MTASCSLLRFPLKGHFELLLGGNMQRATVIGLLALPLMAGCAQMAPQAIKPALGVPGQRQIVHRLTVAGDYIWAPPPGVTSVKFVGFGAGGGGGSPQMEGMQAAAGAGGGGGSYLEGTVISLRPEAAYQIRIGYGGPGGQPGGPARQRAQSGKSGGDTSFSFGSTLLLSAGGGGGGEGAIAYNSSLAAQGKGGKFSFRVGDTIDAIGRDGGDGGRGAGGANRPRSMSGTAVQNGGNAGNVGSQNAYGGYNPEYGASGGGGGGGGAGDGGDSGKVGGSGRDRNWGGSGGGGGGGFAPGHSSQPAPASAGAMTAGGKGGGGLVILIYTLDDGVADSPPKPAR